MRKSAIEIYLKLRILLQVSFNNCEFYLYEKGTSSTKLLLWCYAASVCTSCIFSHHLLGNLISSLVKGIYSYCKTRAWLYCKVYNKEYNIVILFSKRGENFTQERSDNQKTALAKRESKFSVDSVISAEST